LYYEDWDTMAELAEAGRWDIQSHSAAMHAEQQVADGASLPNLTSLSDGETLEEYRLRVAEDMATSAADITEHVGYAPSAYAYPFGAYGKDRTNDSRLRPILAEAVSAEFTLGFVQDDQSSVPLAGCGGDPLRVRRLEVGDWTGAELLDRLAEMSAEPSTLRTSACPS
jgi:peptidoglycan/xylan/chitin deacetylase (PgdA/CDA1 family)